MDNEKTIKEVAVRILEYLVDMGIAPRTVEAFTGIGYRKLYRWMGGQFFRPTLEECAKLEIFLKLTGTIHKDSKEIVASWNGGRFHKATMAAVYRPEAIRILSGKEDLNENAKRLTSLVFNKWAKIKER